MEYVSGDPALGFLPDGKVVRIIFFWNTEIGMVQSLVKDSQNLAHLNATEKGTLAGKQLSLKVTSENCWYFSQFCINCNSSRVVLLQSEQNFPS